MMENSERRPSLSSDDDPNLPPGWKACVDAKNRKYYWHQESNTTQWSYPTQESLQQTATTTNDIRSKRESNCSALATDSTTTIQKSDQLKSSPNHGPSPSCPAPQSSDSDEWLEAIDPNTGKTYYYHPKRRETSWTKPAPKPEIEVTWVETVDSKTGSTYYYNPQTLETSWTKPANCTIVAAASSKSPRRPSNQPNRATVSQKKRISIPTAPVMKTSTNMEKVSDNKDLKLETVRQRRLRLMGQRKTSDETTITKSSRETTNQVPTRENSRNENRTNGSNQLKERTTSESNVEKQSSLRNNNASPNSKCPKQANVDIGTTLLNQQRQHRVDSVESHTSTETTWVEQLDPNSGKKYYYDPVSRESVWELPRGYSVDRPRPPCADQGHSDANPQSDWVAHKDKATNKVYYYSASRNKSVWEMPEEMAQTTIQLNNSESKTQEIPFRDSVTDTGVFQDYAYKQGGGTRFFGRQNWKKRFFVIVDGQMGVYKTKEDFNNGEEPIKSRWIDLEQYRMEEMLNDELGFRLLPAEVMSCEQRVWNLKATTLNQKQAWVRVLNDSVGAKGFMKCLDKALSTMKLNRPELH